MNTAIIEQSDNNDSFLAVLEAVGIWSGEERRGVIIRFASWVRIAFSIELQIHAASTIVNLVGHNFFFFIFIRKEFSSIFL